MWAYDDGRGRRAKDIPSTRPANYYDDAYERAPPRSSRNAYPEPQPKHSSHDRHRRKSALVDPDEPKAARRNTHAGVNVVASDDGSGYPYGSPRDVYGSPYAGRKSRHDVEQKTSDKDRHFREKRGTWETEEAENLRRAKSYSPRRAAREAEAPRRVSPQAPKSNWPEDEYTTQAGGGARHRSSKKSGKGQKSYEDDPYASYYASQAPRSKKHDRGNAGYEYAPNAEEMPRPPMGDHAPYKSSPLTSHAEADEKPSKHHRKRDKDYYGNGYDNYSAAGAGTAYGGGYGAAAADEPPPRRSRHSKHHDDKGAADEYGYAPQPQPRGRHRAAPVGDYGDADPYDRAAPARPRHRQSLPPQPRSQYPDDPYGDPYAQAAPRRRATSVNYGRQDQYGGDSRRDQYYDDGYGRGGGSPAGSNGSKKNNKKSKAYAQQAGKLFMTHAVPVIKKEAVPFLTKAAQAYFEQQKR
ncbi:hypothetical protein J7T55_015682 [Diaporthe amygdali]|uniref:uncharacterized protein n=1 Tax=Phomopsis amygdali TaxID=1214568 RepID=UPI0022FDEBBF|nr:uncharacterized protein J7T55_015682 [Diaporthe amygdali]KAJ0120943.1 hypothetical protein J7T55_015682 [Diaporthe amygdali]